VLERIRSQLREGKVRKIMGCKKSTQSLAGGTVIRCDYVWSRSFRQVKKKEVNHDLRLGLRGKKR